MCASNPSPTPSPVPAPTPSPSPAPTATDKLWCKHLLDSGCDDDQAKENCPTRCRSSPSPTPSPTISPTTSAPSSSETTTASSESACHTSCGSVANGGGACKAEGLTCTSCDTNLILVKGKYEDQYFGHCRVSYTCLALKITSPPVLKSRPCKCNNLKCHKCIRKPSGDKCVRCKAGWYLLNNNCFLDCPDTLTSAGISKWGRECLAPFTCLSRGGCKCPSPTNEPSGCFHCEFEKGQFGQKCTRCRNKKYLNKDTETCEDNCDSLEGLVSYLVGSYRGECRKPFTCEGGLDENSQLCKCSKEAGSANCLVCDWTLQGNVCTRCQKNKYLFNGKCIKGSQCPKETHMLLGTEAEGRECVNKK